jgi:hypothetical protein
MTMATEKIMIGIDDQVIELKGDDLKEFNTMRSEMQANDLLLESEAQAKKQARIDAITKLGEASGLTTDEINAILNI